MVQNLIPYLVACVMALVAFPARAELSVVATTADLASVAAAVGHGRAQVKALALHTQDPHWVDARPSLALDLNKADLLLAVGAELEVGWLPRLQLGSRNPKIQKGSAGYLDCSTLVTLLEVPTVKPDRAHGDVHVSGNPHYLFDPRATERVAIGIGRRLAELDPDGRAVYLENAKRFVNELRLARAGWETRLQKVRGVKVFTYHRSLSYLAHWLGLVVVDTVEPKPGIPPNPSHAAHLVEHGKADGVRALLQESWHPTNTSQLIADRMGGRFIAFPGAPNFRGGQSYIAFMNEIVQKLEAAL